MPSRKYSIANTNYRYGFNGKELDEAASSTTTYDYGFRIYNPALGKFLSVDPLTGKYPWYTPYQFAGNTPIQALDIDGQEEFHYTLSLNNNGSTILHLDNVIYENHHTIFGFKFWPDTKIEGQRAIVVYQGHSYYIGFKGSYGRGNENKFPLFQEFAKAPDAKSFPKLFFNEDQSYSSEFATMAIEMQNNGVMYGQLADEAWFTANNKQTQKVLKVGTYAEMRKLNTKSGMSADHIPSFGALKADVEQTLGRELTSAEAGALRNQSLTLVYETEIHQKFSRTYGGRNNREQINADAANLFEAVQKDIDALKPKLLQAGYSEVDIKNVSQKLLNQFKPKK